MSIYMRGKYWIIDYWPNGRNGKHVRIKTGFTAESDRAHVQTLHDEWVARKGISHQIAAFAPESMIADIAPAYLGYVALHKSGETWRDMAGVFEKHIGRIFPNLKICDLTDQHIALYKKLRKSERPHSRIARGEDRAVSNKTVNKELVYLSAFLNYCEKHLGIKRPIGRIEMLPYRRPVPTVLSVAEVMLILQALNPFYRAFVGCLFFLGQRVDAVRNLTWEDVDFERNTLKITVKGGNQRVMLLPQWLRSLLLDFRGEHDAGYVFLVTRTGRPIREIRTALKNACRKAGITKHVNPHLFRHSMATMLVDARENLRAIQELLGHTRVSTTEWYAQVSVEALKGVTDTIDRAVSNAMEGVVKSLPVGR